MALPGGSQCYQVSVSSSDKIEMNCHTLPPNKEDRGNQVSFWYRFLSKTGLE